MIFAVYELTGVGYMSGTAHRYFSITDSETNAKYVLLAIAYPTIAACLTDYFSLWKTRYFLTAAFPLQKPLVGLLVVALDLFVTVIVFAVAYGATLLLLYLTFPDFLESMNGAPPDILAVAPLLTSAWLWVYLIVAYLVRGLNMIPSVAAALAKIMDFDMHPVRTVGYVAAAASALTIGVSSLLFVG
jgi:hypothetical protein